MCFRFFRIVVVLFNIFQFGSIHARVDIGFLVEEHPKSHPDET